MTSNEISAARKPWRVRILRRPIAHLLLSAGILALDYATGSSIEFPIAFVVPVALSSWFCRTQIGYSLAVIMPVMRLGFVFLWAGPPDAPISLIINLLIRIIVLLLIAYLTGEAGRLTREVKLLKGLLPVCGFCKNIRDADNQWQRFEGYIQQRSDAAFTHTVCPECARIHYGELLNTVRDA